MKNNQWKEYIEFCNRNNLNLCLLDSLEKFYIIYHGVTR